ncbi:MAG: tetratricopeptide repeat protein [Clostridia bacterium]|nr:tetratricopeptide repeat protein [Clostridia bacterium]
MASGRISSERVLARLDEHLGRNDYESARKHLLYWLDEARSVEDFKAEILILNELMGLFRKLGERDLALEHASLAMQRLAELGIENQVGAGTTYLNCATVFKAFGMAQRSIEVFEIARAIYEGSLDESDTRLAGLYNNMALTLVDLGRFVDAMELYDRAISILSEGGGSALEIAITNLNIASALELELGLEEAEAEIKERVEVAFSLIDGVTERNGYYAFVCEKCAPVFGYYGFFMYENDLNERARKIYEGA